MLFLTVTCLQIKGCFLVSNTERGEHKLLIVFYITFVYNLHRFMGCEWREGEN